MQVRLLGPLVLEDASGTAVPVGGAKERALLSLLAIHANRELSEDFLVDALWGDGAPRTAGRTLQGYLSRLRKALVAAGDESTSALESHRAGWSLRLTPGQLDLTVVERQAALARAAWADADPFGAALAYADALREWRGHPLAEFVDRPWACIEAARLEELRLLIVEERVDAELACGRHAALVGDLEMQCRAHPLRERVWCQRMLALYRSGRQAEALRVYQELRSTLVGELGIEPSRTVARLEQAILAQDESLDWTAPGADATAPAEGPPSSERRVVAILVAEVAANGELRPEQAALLPEAIAACGGSELSAIGSAIVAMFEDVPTALRAAMTIQNAVDRHNRATGDEGFAVRVAVHSGSPATRGDTFGTPVIVAKRLCDTADPGEIVASRLALDVAGSQAACTAIERGEVSLPGLTAPIGVWTIERADAGARPLPAPLAGFQRVTFVGRDAELERLRNAWARVRSAERTVVLVAGEPGIGKTTLAAQVAAAATADGAIVLFGRCDEASVVAFQPWVESLSAHTEALEIGDLRLKLGDHASDLALLLPGLGRRLPDVAHVVGTGAESERYRMFDAAATFLRVIAHDAPVVLVLDDLHWADRPTLQLLQHVIRQAGDLPLLILGTYRDTDLVRTHPMAEVLSDLRRADLVERVALRGLSADDVIALVAARQTPDAADDELGRALWHETEGSPLFIRESLRHLAETGAVERDDDGRWRAHRRVAQLGIPEGVREVIGRRLTRLSDAANTALRVGSVLGRELRLDVLEAVTDLTSEQLLDALEEATTAGVIDELPGGKGRWTFTHALVRQSLYDELSMTRRLRMHQRIGEALEHLDGAGDGPHLAPLAHHFTQAAIAGFAAKAIEYEGRAGHYALTIGAYEESARHFAMGLEVAEDADAEPAVRADLLLCQAGAETRAGDARVARRTIERVVALIGTDDPARLATAAVTYAGAGARSLWVDAGAVNERSIALLEQALDALPDDDGELRARALSALGQALQFEPNAQTRRAALSADAVAMARRLGDPALLGDVLCDRFRAIWSPQTVTERITIACEVIAIATAVEDNRMLEAGHTQHAFVLLEVNDLAALRAAAAASEILIEGLRDPLGLELAEFRRGGMAIAEGRLDEAEAHVLEAFRRGQDTRDPNAFTMLAFATGTLRLIQGRAAEVMGAVLHLREFFPAIDFAAEAILAMVYADSGLHEQAVGLLTDLKLASPADVPDLMMLIAMHAAARAAFVAGDGTRARAMYELQLPYADLIVAAGPVPVCSTHLGVALAAAAAGDDEIAEEHFAAALAVHRGNGWRPWIAETQFFLALMVYRRGRVEDRDRVLALLDEVLVIATEVGMTSRAQEARAIRDELLGTGSDPAREGVALRRRDRAKARLSIRGRAAIASWTRGRDDDELARRFGASGAQRALFAATVRAFQPTMAFGFEGDIVYELRPPDDPADPAASDWWTIEVRGRKATAHRGRRAEAAVVIHAGLVDFVRLAAGEMHPAKALLDGLIDVEGDIMLAARLPDMFGSISPLDLSG